MKVDSEIGLILCQNQKDLAPGQRVTLCLRPEFITVGPTDPGSGDNTCQGLLETMVFIGEAYEGEVHLGGKLLITRIEPDSQTGGRATGSSSISNRKIVTVISK